MTTAAIASVNPTTGEIAATFIPLSADDVENRIARAAAAFEVWRRSDLGLRTQTLTHAAEILENDLDHHARLLTSEMGKTIRAARDEVTKCARTLRFYAEHAAGFLADRVLAHDGHVSYEPLGPVLAIMPWNFPYWQVVRFAAPALAAGNVALLKHASNVPRCALELERLFSRAGAPDGVFQSLLIETSAVAPIIADRRIAAVTLTGSEAAGRAVGAAAGQNLKKCVLELGGSDPFVVLADADIEGATRTAVASRTVNNGQSCIAAKRFVVENAVAEAFITAFAAGMRGLRVGDPLNEETDIGPLANRQIRDEVASQVDRTVAAGARIEVGGRVIERPGFFYEPTVLTHVPPDSPAAREEVFGPVAAMFVARDADDALAIANDTRFGLGANVWTRSEATAERFAHGLQAGTVAINGMVASDPRFPFGGVKSSGYGRELGAEGMREFMNVKTVRTGPRETGTTRTE